MSESYHALIQDTGGLSTTSTACGATGLMHQAVLLKTDFMRLLKLAFFLALLFRLAIVKAIALSSREEN